MQEMMVCYTMRRGIWYEAMNNHRCRGVGRIFSKQWTVYRVADKTENRQCGLANQPARPEVGLRQRLKKIFGQCIDENRTFTNRRNQG